MSRSSDSDVPLKPQGRTGVEKLGHREYVGGRWDEIGSLQFGFLVSRGLKPEHYLLDIACGCLRLGVRAIPYLHPEHYLGIEKEAELVRAGLEEELDQATRADRNPIIVVSSDFEFEKLGRQADFAIAQSLFTHLPVNVIERCFEKLRPWLRDTGVLYATYFEVPQKRDNPSRPHDHDYFAYTREEMCAFGGAAGFVADYIGNWNHLRNQVMVEYKKRRKEELGT